MCSCHVDLFCSFMCLLFTQMLIHLNKVVAKPPHKKSSGGKIMNPLFFNLFVG